MMDDDHYQYKSEGKGLDVLVFVYTLVRLCWKDVGGGFSFLTSAILLDTWCVCVMWERRGGGERRER